MSGAAASLPTSAPRAKPSRDSRRLRLAEQLRPLAGRWVAIKDLELLYDDDSAQAVVGWLTRNGHTADSMFRVPRDDAEAQGMAPA
jgi:hypothetical protein